MTEPQSNVTEEAIAAVVIARANLASCEAKGVALRQKRFDLQRQDQQLSEQESRLAAELHSDAADDILRGEEPRDVPARKTQALDRIRSKRSAIAVAKKTLDLQIELHPAEVEVARMPLTSAVIDLANALIVPSVGRIQELLGEMIEPITALLTSDFLISTMVGDQYSVPRDKQAPVRGAILVERLIGRLPPRLQSPPTELQNLRKEAIKRSTKIIRTIEGDN